MKVICLTCSVILLFCRFTLYGGVQADQPIAAPDSLAFVEKVYVQTDRDDYFPADDIWFKAYLVNSADRFLTGHSMNLHVELLSPARRIIDTRIIRLDNGLGHGDFHLSGNLRSGKYRIRAYTNYMRNFGSQVFFNKDISIINTTDTDNALADSIVYTVIRPDITFFPEGGSLVEGIPSIVAFKAVDQHNRSVDISGFIYSSNGDPVTGFKSTHKGMGIFLLDPLPGIKYYAVTKDPMGDTLRYNLPQAFGTGIVMNVAQNRDHQLTIIFRTNASTLPLLDDQDLEIKVTARGNPFKKYTFRMNAINSLFTMPTDDLPDGMVMLTLSGKDNIPMCERLVFIHNNKDINLVIEPEKEEYDRRDSVNIKVSLSTPEGDTNDAFMALAATDDLFMNDPESYPTNIASWFLLESDVKGKVEEPAYYFDPSNSSRLKDLDILLMTQGWRDFKWKYNGMEYPPEYGFTISGRARKKLLNVPVKNAVINIGLFDNIKPFIDNIPADSDGYFRINNVDLTGKAKLIVSVTGNRDQFRGWLLLDSVQYYYPEVARPVSQTNYIRKSFNIKSSSSAGDKKENPGKNIQKFIQHADYISSVQKKYRLSDTIKPGEVRITARRVDTIGSPRNRSQIALGTLFPDKEVVVDDIDRKIYTNAYNLVWRKQLIANSMVDPGGRKIHNPIYLVNGSEVDLNFIKALPVSYIERIDVSNKPLITRLVTQDSGDLVKCDGIISIILKQDFYYSNKITMYSVNTSIKGFDAPRVFYSPKHNTNLESDYKPDFRNTLFWDPDLRLGPGKKITLIFYNSDNPGTIQIRAEGITGNGIPLTGTAEYRVK